MARVPSRYNEDGRLVWITGESKKAHGGPARADARPPHRHVGCAAPVMLAFLVGCHAQARVSSSADPASARHAAVYVDGPVPIPGEEELRVPYVLSTKGEPLLVLTVPPGTPLVFPSTDARTPSEILIRRHVEAGDSKPTETVKIAPKPAPPQFPQGRVAGATPANIVAFEVPQLPAGLYDAWYTHGRPSEPKSAEPPILAPPDPAASQFLTFEVKPQLQAERAVVRGQSGNEVEAGIGFLGPASEKAEPVSVTLSGFNDVVGLASGQKAKVRIGADGYARFKLRLNENGDVYLAAKAPGYASIVLRVVAGPEHRRRDQRLRPGDVLMCQGNLPIISWAIQKGERFELGSPNPHGRPWYSHVALYLGKGETAEMLPGGLTRHRLEETIDGCTTLDVYRRDGMTPGQQQGVADAIRGYRDSVPYAFSQIAVLGAAGAIGLQWKAMKTKTSAFLCGLTLGVRCAEQAIALAATELALRFALWGYSAHAKGKRAMICSELAAWAYRDANVGLDVSPWWPDIEKHGILKHPDAPVDFTTPNMVSQSRDVNFVFQLWPPVAATTIDGDEIHLGEQIVFDTGSAVVSKDQEDLLQDIVDALAANKDIKRLHVEGHTDNVGVPAENHRLSHQRADAVVNWLVAHGVNGSKLTSEGVGDTQPLVPNDNEHNRHKNRRVEFHIVNGSKLAAK